MNLVYASSNQYAPICGVSLLSALKANADSETINIYIIDNGINDENKAKLEQIARQFGRKLFFLDSPDLEKLTGVHIAIGQWNIATFFRLFLHRMLPKSEKRAIYLDCDTLIRHSLEPLENWPLEDAMYAGADDCRCDLYRIDVGSKPGEVYINNGVLVANLERLREKDPLNDFIDFIRMRNGDVTYVDQGVLNGVLGPKNEIREIPPKYNAQRIFFDFSFDEIMRLRKPEYHCSREEYEQAVSDPVVVHFTPVFTTAIRPWQEDDKHPFTKEWLAIRNESPWAELPLDPFRPRPKKKAMYLFSKISPRFFVIFVGTLAHSYFYPKGRIRKAKRALKKYSKVA